MFLFLGVGEGWGLESNRCCHYSTLCSAAVTDSCNFRVPFPLQMKIFASGLPSLTDGTQRLCDINSCSDRDTKQSCWNATDLFLNCTVRVSVCEHYNIEIKFLYRYDFILQGINDINGRGTMDNNNNTLLLSRIIFALPLHSNIWK